MLRTSATFGMELQDLECYRTGMRHFTDAFRRWCGIICLAVAGGMVIAGQTVLKTHLRQAAFIYYWLACIVFTFLTLIIALLDLWIVRRRLLREQKKLVKDALGSLDLEDDDDNPRKRRQSE